MKEMSAHSNGHRRLIFYNHKNSRMIRKDYEVHRKLMDAPLTTFQLNHEHE